MTIPAYTVYANHPRLFFRDTDKATITARTDSSASWKGLWDATIIPASNTYAGKTDAENVVVNSPHQRLTVLALAGYIEETGRPTGGRKARAISSAIYLAGLSDAAAPTSARFRLLALAIVFDLLFDDMTTTEKNTISAEIIQQCDRMASRSDEWMDGWSANDQMCQIAGALAVHGYSSAAQSRLTEALTFFFGAGDTDGALSMERYQYSDGGSEKGGWYCYLDMWHAVWGMTFLTNGTNLNEWTSEAAWASRIWEWCIWQGWRGGVDDDYISMGDTARTSVPRFHTFQRWAFGVLATKYPTANGYEGGRHLAWLYDQYDQLDTPYADDKVFDVVLFDRAAVTSVAPANGTPPPPTVRMFDPPGIWLMRAAGRGTGHADWNHDQSCVIQVSARSRYYLGHPHLDAGCVQIRFKDDVLLLSPSGFYDSYGTTHHIAWYQRSVGQSLVPIIYDPSETFQRWSSTVLNEGGQHFKKRLDPTDPSGSGIASDPYTPYKMLNDDGGEAWKRTERFEEIPGDTTAGHFLIADTGPAYKKFHTDAGKLESISIKYLIIKPTAANGLTWPAMLYYARVRKRNAAHVVTIPLHFRHTATARSFGLDALGRRSELGNGSPGRLWVDVRDLASYDLTITGPGTPLNAAGYGPTQFQILGAGTNYPPGSAAGTRHVTDIKRYSAYWRKKTQVQEEHYVALLMIAAAGDAEPASGRAWVTDVAQPDFYGVTIGSETYLIHRTQDLAVYGSGASPDETPPAEVTDHALVPHDSRIDASWTDPADSDLSKIRIYRRTSAIAP